MEAAGAVSRLPVTGTYHTWTNGRTDSPTSTSRPTSASSKVASSRRWASGCCADARSARRRRDAPADRHQRPARAHAISRRGSHRPPPARLRRRSRDHRRGRRRRRCAAHADARDRLSPAPPVRRGSQLGAHRSGVIRRARGATLDDVRRELHASIPRSSSISRGCSPTSSGEASSRNASRCSWSLPTRCLR